jgi:hypothetical protein
MKAEIKKERERGVRWKSKERYFVLRQNQNNRIQEYKFQDFRLYFKPPFWIALKLLELLFYSGSP